jgi:hypothetical protein
MASDRGIVICPKVHTSIRPGRLKVTIKHGPLCPDVKRIGTSPLVKGGQKANAFRRCIGFLLPLFLQAERPGEDGGKPVPECFYGGWLVEDLARFLGGPQARRWGRTSIRRRGSEG